MEMLVYSTLDVFNEKAVVIADRTKSAQDKKDKEQGRSVPLTSQEDDETYLGLLQ